MKDYKDYLLDNNVKGYDNLADEELSFTVNSYTKENTFSTVSSIEKMNIKASLLESLQKFPFNIVLKLLILLIGFIFSYIVFLHFFEKIVYTRSSSQNFYASINENRISQDFSKFLDLSKNDKSLQFSFYTVEKGDSIYSISQEYGLSMDSLVSMNSMDDAHFIREGNRILIPNVDGILYVVQEGDSLASIKKRYALTDNEIFDASQKVVKEIYPSQVLFLKSARFTYNERQDVYGFSFIKPIHGRFTSGYGYRRDPFSGVLRFHGGIDIANVTGTRVRSAKAGRVVYAGWSGGYGNLVILQHGYGFQTYYGHMSKIYVRKGQYIQEQQVIGAVGSTGRSTGPHLHFEVRRYGKRQNPFKYQGISVSHGWI